MEVGSWFVWTEYVWQVVHAAKPTEVTGFRSNDACSALAGTDTRDAEVSEPSRNRTRDHVLQLCSRLTSLPQTNSSSLPIYRLHYLIYRIQRKLWCPSCLLSFDILSPGNHFRYSSYRVIKQTHSPASEVNKIESSLFKSEVVFCKVVNVETRQWFWWNRR